MKEEAKIYQIKKELEEKKSRLISQLESVNHEINRLQEQCSHNIVFQFDDGKLHKVGKISLCYCPSCEKKDNIYAFNELKDSCFNNSRIIDLSELEFDSYSNIFKMIQEEVFEHTEYYYNENISAEQLSETMCKMIKFKMKQNKKFKRIRKINF